VSNALVAKIKKILSLDPLTRDLTARIWRQYMADHKRMIAVAVFWMAVVAATTGGMAWLIEPALNEAFINQNEFWVWASAGGFLGLAILRGGGSFLQSVIMQGVGLRVIEKMQNEMFGGFLGMEIQFLEREGAARQLSRFTSDCYVLRDAVTKVFTGAGRDLLTLIVMIGLMFYQNWQLAVFSMLFFPLSIMPIARIGRRLRKVSERTQAEFGSMTSVLDDSLKNARQVRVYQMQKHEARRGAEAFATTFNLISKAVRTRALSYPIMEALSGVTLFTITVIGGYQILSGQQTVGSFMSFFFAVFAAYQPMRSLAALNSTLQVGLAAAKRNFSIIDYVPLIQDAPDATPLRPGDGRVELRDVHFSYDGESSVLDGVDIDIPAGETVALVGPSGAGKTTVLNLIPRFYDTTAGQVLIDGQDVKAATIASVMDRIALVSQEPALFNDSIRANIAYGRWGAEDAEIVQAAKDAAAHDFIMELPDGYDTQVGEQGLRLSGGQRQRIAIARAMLKNAPILLLDEATSALDAESERKVQAALSRLMAGRTTVVIAHRLATIRRADRIYVMDRGQVVEIGSHAELVGRDGLYARLCAIQFNDGAEVEPRPANMDAPVTGTGD
jgi:subfamily B ATP-binding cassette protein MsbA